MSKELEDLFLIKCKLCDSQDVVIYPSGYGGEISVSCDQCDNEVEI